MLGNIKQQSWSKPYTHLASPQLERLLPVSSDNPGPRLPGATPHLKALTHVAQRVSVDRVSDYASRYPIPGPEIRIPAQLLYI